MDTQKWAVLLLAAEKGSFSAAAEALGYTQSGITHMMNALEQEAGFPLLLRSRHGVRLTTDAQTLLPRIRALLQSSESLQQELQDIRGLASGNLRIGAFSSILVGWLPRVMRRFETTWPGIHVQLLDGNTSEMTEWLAAGRVDMSFCSRHQPEDTFDWVPLLQDRLFAVLPLGHALAKHEVIPLAAFAEYPYLEFSTEMFARQAFQQAGIHPAVKFSINHGMALVSMIESGLGVGILPELLLNGREQVAVRPIDPPLQRELWIALPSHENASPAANRFLRCALDVAQESATAGRSQT